MPDERNTIEESNRSLSSRAVLTLEKEISGILNEAPWHETGRNARTIAKYSDFRIVLTALKQGTALQEHRAKGCLSI